jgi:hypothetical protein
VQAEKELKRDKCFWGGMSGDEVFESSSGRLFDVGSTREQLVLSLFFFFFAHGFGCSESAKEVALVIRVQSLRRRVVAKKELAMRSKWLGFFSLWKKKVSFAAVCCRKVRQGAREHREGSGQD